MGCQIKVNIPDFEQKMSWWNIVIRMVARILTLTLQIVNSKLNPICICDFGNSVHRELKLLMYPQPALF
jgi:hypothetical protein